MTPDEILEEVRRDFNAAGGRRFLPGLLIAFIRTFRVLEATGGRFASLADFYAEHPRRTIDRRGRAVNTLTVWLDKTRTTKSDKSLSIRPAYTSIETWFRGAMRRFEYPSSAPHATQAWADYVRWLEALLGYTDEELTALEEATKKFVLETLPEHGIGAMSVKREPPRFLLFLKDFDLTARHREATGAAYQAAVFGYLRADAAHLQVDVDKVRVGSKRVGRVGDIDARDGELLVLAAEVKQYTVSLAETPDFGELADQVARHGGLGLVVALDFEEGVRAALAALGLEAMSKDDLIDRVRLWDALKQRTAVQALLYCISYKEKSAVLLRRVNDFFSRIEALAALETRPDDTMETEFEEDAHDLSSDRE